MALSQCYDKDDYHQITVAPAAAAAAALTTAITIPPPPPPRPLLLLLLLLLEQDTGLWVVLTGSAMGVRLTAPG